MDDYLKSDCRLGRNFYKGVVEDTVNVLLAAVAYNFKRAMKVLWCMLQKSDRYCVRTRPRKNGLFKGRLNNMGRLL